MKSRLAFSLCGLAATVLVGALMLTLSPRSVPASKLPVSTVKVMLDMGHGSGVHIGNGFVLTAAHVVQANKTVKLKTQDGTEIDAPVLWSSPAYDAALVYAPALKAESSPFSCRAPVAGELVRAYGNPRHVEFAQTWGRVSGMAPEDAADKGNVVVNITFIGGMSGGPVFDEQGHVIGLVQAVLGQTAFGFMVPMSSICHLLGRVS